MKFVAMHKLSPKDRTYIKNRYQKMLSILDGITNARDQSDLENYFRQYAFSKDRTNRVLSAWTAYLNGDQPYEKYQQALLLFAKSHDFKLKCFAAIYQRHESREWQKRNQQAIKRASRKEARHA